MAFLDKKNNFNQDQIIWFKGELIKAKEAMVNVLSPTAQYGLNVFEGIRGYWSDSHKDIFIFRLNEHLKRLQKSCQILRIVSPYDFDEITNAIINVLQANKLRCDVSIRVTLFVDEEGGWSSSDPVNMFVAPIAKTRRDINLENGKKGLISSFERISDRTMPPRAKVGANYINSRYAYLEAQSLSFDFPIMLDRMGKVSESSGACIMMLRDGVLVTPPHTASIVESITRDTLLELSRQLNQTTQIRSVDRTELYLADEIFLCGSSAEIIPLTSIDNHIIGNGYTGLFTKRIYKEYLNAVTGSQPNWLTPVWKSSMVC
jgi:branched-chain amino acid aminotransferase